MTFTSFPAHIPPSCGLGTWPHLSQCAESSSHLSGPCAEVLCHPIRLTNYILSTPNLKLMCTFCCTNGLTSAEVCIHPCTLEVAVVQSVDRTFGWCDRCFHSTPSPGADSHSAVRDLQTPGLQDQGPAAAHDVQPHQETRQEAAVSSIPRPLPSQFHVTFLIWKGYGFRQTDCCMYRMHIQPYPTNTSVV